ncbi:MAG: glycosyltransferase family 39 protein, partial [Cyanobacteriota bacterium]
MNQSKHLSLHYLVLAGVIALGAVLRFWNLDLKPFWLDEVLTALLSLGHRYQDVPLEVVFSPATLHELFTLQPNLSCSDIAQAVATESTHPPLFFCLMHQWLNGVEPIAQPLSWKLRALPALLGVGAIASIYCLNRIAFSPTAGLMGAAFMAVSPFAVYLSQEARHYTLPVLLIILALLGLMHIQHTLHSRKQFPQPIVWLLWGVVNSFGCYVHYFFILAFIAQLLTLIGLMYWRRRMVPKSSWLAVTLVVMGVAISYLPWLPIVLGDFGRPETSWLPKPQHLAPLYQTLVGWLSMVIALPVEGQPLWIQVISALLTIVFGIWVAQHSIRGFQQLWRQQETRIATLTLSGFILCVLLQFLAIIYLLGKDITIAPRYHFVYYPAICALLGASFASRRLNIRKLKVESLNLSSNLQPSSLQPSNLQPPNLQPPNLQPSNLQPATVFLSISLVSCIFVVSNLSFLKSFHPQQVAQHMNLEPTIPMMMVVGYQNFQDVALGLSFALAIDQLKHNNNQTAAPSFIFLHPEQFYESVWQKLSKLQTSPLPRLNLWVVAPGLRRREYPKQLTLAN